MNIQNSRLCGSCRSPKIQGSCEVCGEPVCRSCTHFLASDAFSFLETVPEVLTHSRYCRLCYINHVEPALTDYGNLMAKAREVIIITKAYKGFLLVLKKSKTEVQVSDCPDRDETVLRLAFKAAEKGHNALIKTELVSKKVFDHSYQKSVWSGHGLPVDIDEEKLKETERQEELWRRGK